MIEVNATARIYDVIAVMLNSPTEVAYTIFKKAQWQIAIPRWDFGVITVYSLVLDTESPPGSTCSNVFSNVIVQDTGDVPFSASDTIALILQRFPGYINSKLP